MLLFHRRIFPAGILPAAVFAAGILSFCPPRFPAQSAPLFSSSDPIPKPNSAVGAEIIFPEIYLPFPSPSLTAPSWAHPRSRERLKERRKMVEIIQDFYGLQDEKILKAMNDVPRHWFVPGSCQQSAYADNPLPIGHGQTISQPFIVAYMTSLLQLDENKKVLEVGTGSGYQAAVLSELTPHVYTIEILKSLAEHAIQTFQEKGYTTIKTRIGDGYAGWPQFQPFDAIIVTCAPDHIPPDLLHQLKPNGRMIIPVGSIRGIQELVLVTKDKHGRISKKNMMPVRFVPLVRKKYTRDCPTSSFPFSNPLEPDF